MATDYLYTGGGTGTPAVPVTGVFSTGFTPAISGASAANGDVIRFNGNTGVTYTATNDLTTPVSVNGFRIDGSANLTVNSSAGSLIQLGGTSPFINFNNANGTVGGTPLVKSNFEFQSSGFIVKSSSPGNFAYDPVMTGGRITFDPGTTTVIALADTGGDSNAELNISSGIAGSGGITLQNNVGGLPAAVAAMVNNPDWGTLQISGDTTAFTGAMNVAFGRLVTSTTLGTGPLTIANINPAASITNTSGGSLNIGGNGVPNPLNGSLTTYGNLPSFTTNLTFNNAQVNLGGATGGDYGYAISNNLGNNTFTGAVTLTQQLVILRSNNGNSMQYNGNSGSINFSGNVGESFTGALLSVSGGGNLVFSGTNNTWTGGINMSGGLLSFVNAGSLPATGGIYLANAALSAPASFASVSAALTSGRINTTSSGVVAISANDSTNVDFTAYPNMGIGAAGTTPVTFTGTITPAGGLYRLGGGGGTLVLPTANTLTGANNLQVGYPGATGVVQLASAQNYTGYTNLSSGYLAFSSGSLPASSQITSLGGGLRFLDANTTDFPASRSIINQGGLYIDTNGFNETISGPITAGGTGTTYGDFHKTGAGTLNVVNTVVANTFYANAGTIFANGSAAVITNHNYTSIGQFPGDNTTVTLDNGATYPGTGDFNIADVGGSTLNNLTNTGTLNILNTNGATPATQISAGTLYVGKGSDTTRHFAVGVVNQGPNTVVSFAGNDQIGVYGNGFYNQTGGVANFTGFTALGRQLGGVGVYNFSGGTINSNSATYFIVGEIGTGTLNISGNAVLNTNAVSIAHADGIGATGTINQTGGTINAPVGGVVFSASGAAVPATSSAVGVYNFNGGTLVAKSISQAVNPNHVVSGTFNFNGGYLQASTGASATFISGITAANVLGGGAIIDNNGQAITIAQNLSHATSLGGTADGGLKLIGTGTVTVSSTASTYTGPTQITGGTLRLAASTTTVSTLNTSSIAAFYSFEDQNNLFHDSSGNGNDLLQATDNNNNPQGNAVFSTIAPPSSATTGTHVGSLFLNNSAYLLYNGANLVNGNPFPVNVPVGNQPYTIAAWINGSGVPAALNGYGIVGWGTYGTTNLVTAFRTNNLGGGTANGLQNYWWNNDINGVIPGTGQTAINQWHYVVATYDPSTNTRSIYVDGTVVAQDSPAPGHNASSTNFAVGATNNFQEFFDGNMADLLIANSAFTLGQAQLAETGNFNGTLSSTTPGGQLPLSTVVQISPGATFDLNGNNQTIGGLLGSGFVTLGAGTLQVVATTAGEYDGVISGTGGLVVGGTAPLTLGGVNTLTGTTNVSTGSALIVTGAGRISNGGNLLVSGSVTFQASAGTTINQRNLGSITLNTGGSVVVQPALTHASRTLLVTTGVSGATGSFLDLSNNDMVVTGGSLSAVSAAVAAGFGGTNGIVSSTAGANPAHTTALGVIQNNQGGTPLFTAANPFAGYTPGAADILVKYTYFGDANLDGKVDGSDYSRIDVGYLNAGASGWYNGDFNYDGKVDASDYTLIDNAYNRQAAQLTTPTSLVASPTALVAGSGSSAVPEPTSAAALLVGVGGLLARRRRR